MVNEVYQIDCMEYMKTLPDKYFELAITDPMYSSDCNLKGGSSRHGTHGWKTFKTDKIDKINYRPKEIYFRELERISRNQIIWGGNYFVKEIKNNCSGWIFWDKGQRNFSLSDGELAYTSFNIALRVFEYSRSLSNFTDEKTHPFQKPVALYRWLLTNYAKLNDKIFDSHVGSDSSRIAAYELGFDFVGCELDRDYWEAQEKRFKLEKAKIDNEFYLPEIEGGLF